MDVANVLLSPAEYFFIQSPHQVTNMIYICQCLDAYYDKRNIKIILP